MDAKSLRHRVDSVYQYKHIPVHAPIAVHEFVASWISAHVDRGLKVCDIGCGSGAMSQRLLDCGYEVIGLDHDLSDFQPRTIKTLRGGIAENQETLSRLGPVECAVALEVIEHTENPIEFLQELKRTRIPNILMSFPNLHEIHNVLYFCRRGEFSWWNPDSYYSVGHITLLTDWLFERHCDYVGLDIVEKQYLDLFRPKRTRAFFAYLLARLISNSKVDLRKRLAGAVVYVLRNPYADGPDD